MATVIPRPHPVPPDVMTPGEVMSLLRISRPVLYRLEREGTLPVFRTLGGHGHRRYFRSDVTALLNGSAR